MSKYENLISSRANVRESSEILYKIDSLIDYNLDKSPTEKWIFSHNSDGTIKNFLVFEGGKLTDSLSYTYINNRKDEVIVYSKDVKDEWLITEHYV